ncbi:pyridoxamine 5'-phosphate oxidase family protein [Wenxinia marina]|uniref:Putative stress protein (General stress protein 26) n=1 Tax=Wenxinia marina DSM 24838 TaxID=1123501 RepID=A0A0D0Q5Z4_9RHOB|nr:pyridoxamine 5'-phosphate oxidase family protein [Wenxinia marina]KIQ69899.1 putative stress protein (general stress protein 26) [Wenxinia marina DSM 24838]GGL62068.1 general stress protein [Wenxinia marina]
MHDKITEETFWKHLEDVREGMLAVGPSNAVPMTHYADPETRALYFITARGTDTGQAAMQPSEAVFIVASHKQNMWARIHGRAVSVRDPAKLDEYWNRFAGAWFDGKDDPNVELIRMDLTEAEVWLTDGNAKFLYEMAKANVSGAKPDVGAHDHLRFAA